jgi:phospho-N-acetylmuramoyl-pentapeptide-transferase
VLYAIFVPLIREYTFLNVFTYITFRAAGAAVTALLLSFIVGPIILRQLQKRAFHQVVREGTPD